MTEPLVLCCGSRNWSDWAKIKRVLHQLLLALGRFKLIHGGARGVDSDSGATARILGLEVEVVRADWVKYGKRAGMFRNTSMLEREPDYVVAFWDGISRGTLDTIQKAVNVYQIPTIIIRD